MQVILSSILALIIGIIIGLLFLKIFISVKKWAEIKRFREDESRRNAVRENVRILDDAQLPHTENEIPMPTVKEPKKEEEKVERKKISRFKFINEEK